MVPLAAQLGSLALMNGPGDDVIARKLLATAGNAAPPNEAAARIGLLIAAYSPGRRASKLRCPALFCLCSQDHVAPASVARRYAEKVDKAEILEYPIGHFNIYMDEPFERVIVDQIAFLERHVPPAYPTASIVWP